MRLWELLDTKSAQIKKPIAESAKKPQDLTELKNRLIVPAPKVPKR